MQWWITAIVGTLMVAFGTAAPATAQLIGGGLTTQPTVRLGSDLLTNGAVIVKNGTTTVPPVALSFSNPAADATAWVVMWVTGASGSPTCSR